MISFILYSVIILALLIFSTQKLKNSWIIILIVNLLYYGFVGFVYYQIKTAPPREHETGGALGIGLFVLFTSPLLALYDAYFVYYARKHRLKAGFIISLIFLIPVIIVLALIGYDAFRF